MAYSTKLRSGSFVLLGIGFLSWVIALGGLGATTWCVFASVLDLLKPSCTLMSVSDMGPAGYAADKAAGRGTQSDICVGSYLPAHLCVLAYNDCRMVCSDTENTLKSIVETSAASTGSVPPADELAMAALKKDVAFCSRSWRWYV